MAAQTPSGRFASDDDVEPGAALWHELQALRRSETVLRDFIETATIGLHWVGADGTVLWANQAELDLLGYAREEYIGRNITDIHADAPVIEEILARLSRGEKLCDFPARLRHRDGSIRQVLITSSALFEDGKFIHTRCFTRDVTALRQHQDASVLLAAIVDSSDDAIISKDLTGRIMSWNKSAERIFGYTAEEAVGRSITMLIPEDRQDEEPRILGRLQRGERVDHFETIRRRKDGTLVEISLTISPVRDQLGRIIGASKIARDISDRKRTEDSLRETQKLESLGLLAGGIAHDFNNLLTGVVGNASLLAEDVPPGSTQAETVQSLMDSAERMARLTAQMLAYSGRGQFLIEPVDLSTQVIQITSLIQASIPKNVEVRLALANDLPLIEVDISQLQQIIMNLVINAAEAIGSGPGTVELTTSVESVTEADLRANLTHTDPPAGAYVAMCVEDTGCGMDEETRARIFDPFFTTKFTGRGLGLSSVLGIVRGHKGLITLDSRPGAGTKFRVFFPISAVRHAARSSPVQVVRGSGAVLVVDDEDVIRKIAKTALQRLGYVVLTAANGEFAVELYSRNSEQIDVVLLDMVMPVMSGEETLKRLLEIRPDATVVAMSGFDEREAKRCFGNGIAEFLQKPFTASQLAAKIAAARRASVA
jgi:two-component system cell cycle sensor histidine kinase/response regulator CckA